MEPVMGNGRLSRQGYPLFRLPLLDLVLCHVFSLGNRGEGGLMGRQKIRTGWNIPTVDRLEGGRIWQCHRLGFEGIRDFWLRIVSVAA